MYEKWAWEGALFPSNVFGHLERKLKLLKKIQIFLDFMILFWKSKKGTQIIDHKMES